MPPEEEKTIKKEPAKKETSNKEKPAKKAVPKQKKARKNVTKGKAYILATYNNTIISFTDENGNLLQQGSAGKAGFRGPKKATPYAAGIIVKDTAEIVKSFGLKDIAVVIKGIGSGRDGALRALNAAGFNILSIKDRTPIPHNGCRAKKPRRV